MASPFHHFYQAHRPAPIIVETLNPGYSFSYTIATDSDDEMARRLPRRPASAPTDPNQHGATGEKRKRPATAEPTRLSKRLRNIPPSDPVEEAVPPQSAPTHKRSHPNDTGGPRKRPRSPEPAISPKNGRKTPPAEDYLPPRPRSTPPKRSRRAVSPIRRPNSADQASRASKKGRNAPPTNLPEGHLPADAALRPQATPHKRSRSNGTAPTADPSAFTNGKKTPPSDSSEDIPPPPPTHKRPLSDETAEPIKRARTAEPEHAPDGVSRQASVEEAEDVEVPKADCNKREFTRTVSSGSSTAAEDDAVATPMSSTSTLPTPTDPQFPKSQPPLSTSTSALPTTAPPPARPPVVKPPELHIPSGVLIKGWPPLRVVFRNHCYYRHDAPTLEEEWRSISLIEESTSRTIAARLKKAVMTQGYIDVPTSLFPNLTGAQLPSFTTLFTRFFDRHCLPDQPLLQISDFVDPETGKFDLIRLGWWDTLCSFFQINTYFNKSFATNAADWHIVYHSLTTFAEMRDFCEKLDRWKVMRGAEDMHLELARRIALAVGGGTVDAVVYTKLSRMSGDQLWIESKFWDGLEGDWDEHCSICVIRPAFVGDSFAR